jgi:hypothetical protein
MEHRPIKEERKTPLDGLLQMILACCSLKLLYACTLGPSGKEEVLVGLVR